VATLKPIGHEERLSLVDHLDELRSRMITCVLALVVCFAFTYWQNDRILDFVNQPLEQTQNLSCEASGSDDPLEQSACSQVRSGEAQRAAAAAQAATARAFSALASGGGELTDAQERALRAAASAAAAAATAATAAAEATPTNRERQPVTLGVAEPFTTTFVVAGYAALLLALPILLFQAYAFVLPAFTPKEKRTALPLMLMVPFLFVGGVAFAYFVALPRAVDFLQNFNDDDYDILVQARDYYRFAIVFMGGTGILFQIPVGVLLITRLGVVSVATLRKNRGYVLIALAVIAAVATPTPDPITMLFALGPLVILFELSLFLAAFFEKRHGSGRDRWRWDDEEDEDDDEDPWAAFDDADEDDEALAPLGRPDADETGEPLR
jgi:sec-independent protein translocase protein TatC